MASGIAQYSANAVIPDQLADYVNAVSGLKTRACGSCLLHSGDGHAVLAAYPAHDPLDTDSANASLRLALELPGIEHISVLSAARPELAPETAQTVTDTWWMIPLPASHSSGKLRNMLKRASREVEITMTSAPGAWSGEHKEIVENFCERKAKELDDGSMYIFRHLDSYIDNSRESALFSARQANGKLVACAIGDYTSLLTAFYMFAFRLPDSPPGVADLLLDAVASEGEKRGHIRLNLGLGIDKGIEFFKKKWGAESFLPYTETCWSLKKNQKSWFSRLFGG